MWFGYSKEFWLGSVLAALFAVISTTIGLRRRRSKILVGIVQSASLLSEVAREVPNLKVLYNDKELGDELVWITGVIANTGKQDVGKTTVATFPMLKLGSNAEWREFSIGPLRDGLEAKHIVHDRSTVEVVWNILRSYESIPFTALIGTSDRSFVASLRDGQGLEVSARIENKDCEFEGELVRGGDIKQLRGTIAQGLVSLALALFLTWGLFTGFFDRQILVMRNPAHPSIPYGVEESDSHPGSYLVTNLDNSNEQRWMSDKELSNYTVDFMTDPGFRPKLIKVIFSIFALFMIFSAFVFSASFRRQFRRYRYLNAGSGISDLIWKSKKT